MCFKLSTFCSLTLLSTSVFNKMFCSRTFYVSRWLTLLSMQHNVSYIITCLVGKQSNLHKAVSPKDHILRDRTEKPGFIKFLPYSPFTGNCTDNNTTCASALSMNMYSQTCLKTTQAKTEPEDQWSCKRSPET